MESELVDRRVEEGVLIELRRSGDAYEVSLDGRTAIRSAARRSEKELAELALAPWAGRSDISVLLGGLGMGYTLRALLDAPGVERVDVVEMSGAMVEWDKKYFSALNKSATQDSRVNVHHAELGEFMRRPRSDENGLPKDGWFVVVVDLDEWPAIVTRPGNQAFYAAEGLELIKDSLRPGGVVALWTTLKDVPLLQVMSGRFQNSTRVGVPVDVDGVAGLDYVYRGRRGPARVVN